ncbi:hypothetical protein E5288_WYG010334 [Bos mutus]|uniref:Uncharacterized protein n=1 Tax=Bos mutus TaxID=72004 RepID=A0A6B0SE55_9CETA|nr:hypothetical protein [Bos mutus]
MVVALAAWLLLASMTGVQQQQDFNNLKAVNIQGKLVLLKNVASRSPTAARLRALPRRTYSVTFPMFSKITVASTGVHPAFKYLTETSGKEPSWNF